MSERATSHRPIAAEGFYPFALPAVADLWTPAVSCSAEWNRKLHDSFVAMSGEWQEFVALRLKQDLDLAQRVAQATSPAEAWAASVEFWQRAVEDYWREYSVMSRLAAGFINATAAGMQQRITEPASTAPLPKAA